jgi:FdhD protein
MPEAEQAPQGMRCVQGRRIDTRVSPPQWVGEDVRVVVEAALTIDVEGFDTYTLLCTPTDTEALAMGFLFTEGVIAGPDDLAELRPCADDASVIRARFRGRIPPIGEEGRNLLIASSCGLCGVESVEKKLASLPAVGDQLRIGADLLKAVNGALRERQTLFKASGGSHAAGIFAGDGELLAWAEDAGRHNALDKAIGSCLVRGVPTAGCGVVLSGRASLDMVGKCARAGIELISAVSAPTSLAVDIAEHTNITLCGFVREERATIFSHPRRIVGVSQAP